MALVAASEATASVTFRVVGPRPHYFFSVLRRRFEDTYKSRYPALAPEIGIRFPGHDGHACDHEFELSELTRHIGRRSRVTPND